MFTSRAVGVAVVAVILFFLASATNVGWVRIVDAVLWGMLGLSLLLQWLSVTAVEARRRIVRVESFGTGPGPMEDDVVVIDLELVNGRFWPRFFLSVAYDAPMERASLRSQRYFLANLWGHDTERLTSRLTCHRRGLHRFGPVTVESQAPFGLFRRIKRREAPLSILVYPQVLPMRRLALVEHSRGISDSPQRARGGVEVMGSRQYYPGDPLRHIHWRNTARLRKLVVKEMVDTAENALAVAFDVRRDFGKERESTLEYSVKLAAAVGAHALKSGKSVRLAAGNLRREWSALEPFLRELALLKAGPAPSLEESLQTLPRSSPALAIVAAADEDGVQTLLRARSNLPALAAVVLEGFADPGERVGAAEALRLSGIPTVVCRQGDLASAILALEGLGSIVVAGADRP